MTDTSFDEAFDALPSARDERGRPQEGRLGLVVGGSLSAGLDVKLDREIVLESLAVGRYVVARGSGADFFCMVTDVALDNTNPQIAQLPPDAHESFAAQVHRGTTTFGTVHLSPLLILDTDKKVRPVKTVPAHFTTVHEASQGEVNDVFGEEGTRREGGADAHYFHVGAPLDMEEVKITLKLERLVERSSGVFGKSGTGKTFLSRLLLAGVIRESVAVNLIFDMHNEYGWAGGSEGLGGEVKGLKQVFPGRVSIFTLDEESSLRRNVKPDYVVEIGYDNLEPEDLEMLSEVLALNEVQVGAAFALARKIGKSWLRNLLDNGWVDSYGGEKGSADSDTGLQRLAADTGQSQQTLAALLRRFERIRRYDFLKEKPHDDSVARLMRHLEANNNVVLEFGRFGSDLGAYILVANYLTRRIHERYVKRMEESYGRKVEKPRPLVITIEEAHKFLDPRVSSNTIFGTIARELRKYNVTLFIVDQRPSAIDPEVMSQIGTRVTLLLDDPSDIQAVLSGVSGAGGLREVLARLDSQEQALMLGHAVPMPVVIQARRYDLAFYQAMGMIEPAAAAARLAANATALRGEPDFAGFD